MYDYVGQDSVNFVGVNLNLTNAQMGVILTSMVKIIQGTNNINNPQKTKFTLDIFWTQYTDMKKLNWIGTNKYFHCKANCLATKNGSKNGVICWSFTREMIDIFKGDSFKACNADFIANKWGRDNTSLDSSCTSVCRKYIPNNLLTGY